MTDFGMVKAEEEYCFLRHIDQLEGSDSRLFSFHITGNPLSPLSKIRVVQGRAVSFYSEKNLKMSKKSKYTKILKYKQYQCKDEEGTSSTVVNKVPKKGHICCVKLAFTGAVDQ
jgi:hypothetical protein